ncbi:MAG: YkgJ family cysteine cluster protein [Silvibacterium sp.]
MPGPDAESSGFRTVQFALKVQDTRIDVNAQLPEGPIRPAVLLPIIQNLSNSLSEIAERRAELLGRHVSCREGCGACCRQAVPITPVEAGMLSEWIAAQPEERKAILRARFRHAAERLEGSGIAQSIREASLPLDKGQIHVLGLKYFALGIPCPFLEEERCTIHPIRPLRCREYMVVSAAEHCAHPESKQVVGIKPPVLLSQVLGKWSASGEAQPFEFILLTMLDEWEAAHPAIEDRAIRGVPELLQEFLHAFASENAAADTELGAPSLSNQR